MSNKNRKLMITSLAILTLIFLLFNINNIFIYSHQITPLGKELSDTNQIKKDIAKIFREEYKINNVKQMGLVPSIALSLGKDKEVLERAFQLTSDKTIQITLEDKKIRWNPISLDKEAKELAVNSAVRFLIYFTNREYEPTIKSVNLFYTPRMFDFDSPQVNVVIVIDEFLKEYEQLKNDGFSDELLIKKLEEKFIY